MKNVKTLVIGILITLCFSALNIQLFAAPASPQEDYTIFDPLVDVVNLLQQYYVTQTDDADLVSGAINGMLHELDPYSEYIPAADLAEFNKQTSGNYEGLGVGIDIKDGYIVIISPFEDSPAYKAGIRAGDIILEVNGQSTKGWSATQAVKKMTGAAGTKVTLKVLHKDGTEEELTITRQKIHVPVVRGWRRNTTDGSWDFLLDRDKGIGYIRVTQFTAEMPDEFDKAVRQLQKLHMQALIIDLRSNPGGLMSAAITTVDRMIDSGVILSTRGAHTPRDVKRAHAEGTYPHFPLVILIDQGSASASEIVAGSLQDHDRAVIVGKRSWGKGSVQRVFKLPESGAAVKLTTDYYYLPKGRCVHKLPNSKTWGVMPDVEEDFDPDKIPALRKLTQKLTIEPLTLLRQKQQNKQKQHDTSPKNQEDPAVVKELARQLLSLDNQLDQAYKQCKGLIRARPPLSSLAETITSNDMHK